MLSFINSDFPNCDARSFAVFYLSSFHLKTTSFLCYQSLNSIMTSLFFIWWQHLISSSLIVVPVSDSTRQTLRSSASLPIDWDTGFFSNISVLIYWGLFRAFFFQGWWCDLRVKSYSFSKPVTLNVRYR